MRPCVLLCFLALVIILPIGSSIDQAQGQSVELDEATQAPPVELRGVMVLRISENYLAQLFARDIDKTTQVQRTILGTRARGTAHTTGKAEIDTQPDADDAAFRVNITGRSESYTRGRNGPAIIHSRAVTDWQAVKTVRFDGLKFRTSDASIESTTQIFPQGVQATVPGLRGALVRKVANRRICECLPTAERLTGRDTEQRVLGDVDKLVDERIERLNQRIDSRPIASALLPTMSALGVEFSSSSNCININFVGEDTWPLAQVVPFGDGEPSDTELWMQIALLSSPDQPIPRAIDDGAAWLSEMIPDLELPGVDLTGEEGLLPFNMELIDGWVVFRSKLKAGAEPTPANPALAGEPSQTPEQQ